ncbi:MAG: alpha/beta hydrolase [Hyphomicrobiaceae bacterium]
MAITVSRDIVFARTRIGYNGGAGPMQTMDMKLDAYLPSVKGNAPALVLAFGGAFHRGSKEDDTFPFEGGPNTPIAEYCRYFAGLGIPSFSISYRLAQTDPEPPEVRVLSEPANIPMERINLTRSEFSLPPIAPETMAGMMEAAFEDVLQAINFVATNADRFGIDPSRIVAGGFSAGARSTMYAAYAKDAPVKGVVALSGPMMPVDAGRTMVAGKSLPPLLTIYGEKDLGYVCDYTPQNAAQLKEAAGAVECIELADATHFYPSTRRAGDGRTVRTIIRDSLARWVAPLPEEATKAQD